jgi:hypothetical protein
LAATRAESALPDMPGPDAVAMAAAQAAVSLGPATTGIPMAEAAPAQIRSGAVRGDVPSPAVPAMIGSDRDGDARPIRPGTWRGAAGLDRIRANRPQTMLRRDITTGCRRGLRLMSDVARQAWASHRRQQTTDARRVPVLRPRTARRRARSRASW